jgi:hypothetical protein
MAMILAKKLWLVLLLKNKKRKDSGVKLAVSAFLLMNGF